MSLPAKDSPVALIADGAGTIRTALKPCATESWGTSQRLLSEGFRYAVTDRDM
jgi:hypothetical protein